MDPTTVHTLGLWFKILKMYRIQNDINILKWVAHDRFKPAMYDSGFKHWLTKGITTWCVLVKDGRLESFESIRRKYELGAHEFYRYLQMRDYFKREIESDSPKEVNGVIQIIIKAYQDSNIRIISAMYRGLNTNDKHSTKYIKTKWEKELNVQISDEDWHDMWRAHHSSTSSRTWREFSWKNLIRFFITPKVKSKQLNKSQKCWRECGSYNVDHAHVFWNCHCFGRWFVKY